MTYGQNPNDNNKPYSEADALQLATCDACSVHDPLAKKNCKHYEKHQVEETKCKLNFIGGPECDCGEEEKQLNSHRIQCQFYQHFYDNYQDRNSRPQYTPNHICCCQDDIFPHQEDEKFMIIKGQSQDQQYKDEEFESLNDPLFLKFHPGELVDHQGKSIRFSSLDNKDFHLLIERNVEIFEVAKFLSDNSVEYNNMYTKNVLSVLGSEDTGNYQIVVFAVNYCRERNIIHEAIYVDFSQLNLQDMLDRLNILLELNVLASRTQEKYVRNIIDKINEKFKKIILPITLIIDNLNKNNKSFQHQQNVLIKMKNNLSRVKIIIIEKTDLSCLDPQLNSYSKKFENFDYNDKSINGGQEKICEILRNLAVQKEVNLDHYWKYLTQEIKKELNNNNKINKFLQFIQDNQKQSKYTINPSLLIVEAFNSRNQTTNQNTQSQSSEITQQRNQTKDQQKGSLSNRCQACYQKLYQYINEDDNLSNRDNENHDSQIKLSNELPKPKPEDEDSKNIRDSQIQLPNKLPKLESDDKFIEEYRANNPFDFSKYFVKFNKMNTDKFLKLESQTIQVIDGTYRGDTIKDTRIQHGRGIFREEVVQKDQNVIHQSIYEGWKIRNKREIYGRLIERNGLIYEGEFKNNFPHGKGKAKQIDSIEGIYPQGFEFNGNFQNGMRDGFGIIKIPSGEMKHQLYCGYFDNNQMDGIFNIINQDGDQFITSYGNDVLRKFPAYVFTAEPDKPSSMYGFIPQVHDKDVNLMPKIAFISVCRLIGQNKNQLFKIMDIQQKENQMLLEFEFANLWIKNQGERKNNLLFFELLLGYYPQLEPIFYDLVERVREKFQIQKKNIQRVQQDTFTYNMVSVKTIENNVDKSIQQMEPDSSLVEKIINDTMLKLDQILHSPQETQEIWKIELQKLIIDENISQDILENLSHQVNQKEKNEKKGSNQKLPDKKEAKLKLDEMNQAEKLTLPIQEYINLQRLVEEQDFANDQMYNIKTKQDVIQSLLYEQQYPNLMKYRVILGRALLEMCVSMHFVNNQSQNCIEQFMEKDILQLFKNSGYYQMAIEQQIINQIQLIDFQIDREETKINDLLDCKNLKTLEEQDPKLISTLTQQTICDEQYGTIIDKAIDFKNQAMKFKGKVEIQQNVPDKEIWVKIFFNFLGAIAQLINPEQAVKFVLDILKKTQKHFKSTKESELKMKKLYKFRKIHELEKHIGYKFKDSNILVQSLIHESYSKQNMKQSNLEKSGKLVVKFMILRESILKANDLKFLENLYSFEFLQHLIPENVRTLATLLGLHSKLIYEKIQFNSKHEFFESTIKVFQMENQVDQIQQNFKSMIDNSIKILKKSKLSDDKTRQQPDQQLYSHVMQSTLFAFIGALNIDSSLCNKSYISLLTLFPYFFHNTEYYEFFKKECLSLLEENQDIINFPKIFRVSKEAFQTKTFSMNDCFDYPGKLLNIKEFDIYNDESYDKLVKEIKDLENKNKHNLINIIFNDEMFSNSTNYIETSYYIVHSHVVSLCLRKENPRNLLKDFLTRMRNSAKQRVINEQQMLIMTKDDNSCLTLAQKIKILINLNDVQYQTIAEEAEKLYKPPSDKEAMNYVNRLKVKKEKTFDSIIYSYEFKDSNQNTKNINYQLKPDGVTDLHFIKQPLLQQHETDIDTKELIKKNKKYIYNNILENQLIQLSHFLSNQESAKQNELIILDEEQLRVVDYMALRQNSEIIDKLPGPIELLSVCFQIIALATQYLHEFDVYHGNIKPDRLKLNYSGYDSFFFNGNFVILQPDPIIQKILIDSSKQEDIKSKTVNEIELYTVDKISSGHCTQFMKQTLNKKKFAKCELYREEAYQVLNTISYLIRIKKQQNPSTEQLQAIDVLQKIGKLMLDYKDAINKKLEMKTLFEIQQKLAENLSIAEESITLFRACLKPTFSRNLWIYLDQMSPLHPKLQKLVFPWKQFMNKPIDLDDLIQKNFESDEQNKFQTNFLSPESEIKMSILRKLHLGFIEDWWFEIATLMGQSQESYDRIDSNELEYVKSMIQRGGIRVKLDWLSAKILIIKYFKALAIKEQQLKASSSNYSSSEEGKNEEESKKEEVEPDIILQDIKSKIIEMSDSKEKKVRKTTLSQSSSNNPIISQDDEIQEQEQLRHFVKAAIYPLKDVHIKIYKIYGPGCLNEYIKIILEALEWIQSDSFQKKMEEAFNSVKEQSQVIKGLLEKIQIPAEQNQ